MTPARPATDEKRAEPADPRPVTARLARLLAQMRTNADSLAHVFGEDCPAVYCARENCTELAACLHAMGVRP